MNIEFQLASMPMTPAITDLTRHGSSSSPSTTNSDPPYSPEGLNNFGLGTQRPNHGVIPNDISNVPQHINRQFNPRMGPNTSPNPPSFPQFLNSNHPTPGSYVQV